MRTIKFRFWSIHGKDMIDWNSINQDHLHDYLSLDEDIVIPMQFTGLLDKNGNEIYEGDIIKSTTDFYNVKKERTTIIEWNNDIENDSFGCPITAGYSILGYDWEIIGNIHENPELVK